MFSGKHPIMRSDGLTNWPATSSCKERRQPTPLGQNVPEFNVTLTFNCPVTNIAPNTLGDMVLMLCDDPAVAGQPALLNTTRFNSPTPPVAGAGSSGVNFQNGSVPNIFRGASRAQTPSCSPHPD